MSLLTNFPEDISRSYIPCTECGNLMPEGFTCKCAYKLIPKSKQEQP